MQDDKIKLLQALNRQPAEETLKEPAAGSRTPLTWKIILIIALVAPVLFYISSLYLSKSESSEKGQSNSSVVQKPEKASPANFTGGINFGNRLSASGYVVARRTATVSSEIMGTISEVLIEEGMQVEVGQIVARLDNTIAQTEQQFAKTRLPSLKANQEALKAQLDEAERVSNRLLKLQTEGAVSEASLTDAQARKAVLKAQLTQAQRDYATQKIELQRREQLLQKHILRAPFSGIVINKNAQAGEIIAPGSAGGGFTRTGICTIVDMDSLEIEVDVNEANIARIQAGGKANATLDAYPGWRIPAKVIAIIPTADRAKATIKVRIGLEQKDARILPEMAAKVEFELN